MTNPKRDWQKPPRGMWAYGSTNVVDFRDYHDAVAEIERVRGAFKNFHRLLCERFGYGHDEVNWERDQLSLIEHIAELNATPGATSTGESSSAREDSRPQGLLTQDPLEGATAFELRQMTAQRDHWLEIAREKDAELGRLCVALQAVRETVQRDSPQWLLADQLLRMLGGPPSSDEPSGHVSMAEFLRYKQALTRANGFLIMNNLEPVKLEYAEKSTAEVCPRCGPDGPLGNL